MDPHEFFTSTRVLIVAGKGGVGKSTVSATLSLAAARAGLRVLVVEVEGSATLAAAFGVTPLTYQPTELVDPTGGASVTGRLLTPEDALVDYLRDKGLGRVTTRLFRSGALDVVATAAPGIDDILVLGKVKQLERSGLYDLVVVDAPAAGHAITFLTSARGLLDAVRVGPVRTQAADVLELLTDAGRCQVVLVTLPEETPVNEITQTAYALEDKVGVNLGPVVVNGCWPNRPGLTEPVDPASDPDGSLRTAVSFARTRVELQREQIERLARSLPLPQLELPYVFTGSVGPAELSALADHASAALAATSR